MDKRVPTTHHTAENLQAKALGMVAAYYNTFVKVDTMLGDIQPGELFVVWFCKTLQNWKALVATHRQDSLYFEVTHDGDQKRTYIDQYIKIDNFTIYDEEPALELPKSFGPVEFLAGQPHPDDITSEPEKYPVEWCLMGIDNFGELFYWVEKLEEYRSEEQPKQKRNKFVEELSDALEQIPKKRELPQVFQNLNPAGPDRFA